MAVLAVVNNYNHNNTVILDTVAHAVIMLVTVVRVHNSAADCQTKTTDLFCESACRLLSTIPPLSCIFIT